ncbi:MAG: MnhB domain-containing protein [Verrucomicrobiota bacterium]
MIDSLILRLASRALFLPLLLLSVVVLYRGHNLPGGGFIGGLLASAPFVLVSLASGVEAARTRLRFSPITLMATGITCALAGALPSLFFEETFFTGLWLPGFTLPVLGAIHLGTPLVFDIGVYFTVIGFTLAVVFNLEEVD